MLTLHNILSKKYADKFLFHCADLDLLWVLWDCFLLLLHYEKELS